MRNITKQAVDTVYNLLWLKQNDPENPQGSRFYSPHLRQSQAMDRFTAGGVAQRRGVDDMTQSRGKSIGSSCHRRPVRHRCVKINSA